MRRVVVSGIGLESPIGRNLDSVADWVMNPRSALTAEDFALKSGVQRRVLVARALQQTQPSSKSRSSQRGSQRLAGDICNPNRPW